MDDQKGDVMKAKPVVLLGAHSGSLCRFDSTVGDLMPARKLCKLARERGVLSLVDGAQSLGLIEVNLAEMQPEDLHVSIPEKVPPHHASASAREAPNKCR